MASRVSQKRKSTQQAALGQDLTPADVTRLLQDPSGDTRASLASKMAGQIDSVRLTPEERSIAEDILRIMARDASQIVREALAVNLKASRNLPHDVAIKLANDIDSVALPILEFSSALTDADLVELVQSRVGEERQTAIARRAGLSGAVADALVETAESPMVIETLVSNETAELAESTLNKVVDRFGDNALVQEPLARRQGLPLAIAERLVARVSDNLRDYLIAHHDLSPDTASELTVTARERATVGLVGDETDETSLVRLVENMHVNGRLTPSLILRALCCGDIMLFEMAMARLAHVPVHNARILIHDGGPLGLKSIYEKAGLPEALLPVFRLALEVLSQTGFQERDYDRDSFARVMLERILTHCTGLSAEDEDYLLRKLNDLAPPSIVAA